MVAMDEHRGCERLSTLAVMRHGQSTWTDRAVNRFAGWVDVPLTAKGRDQARHAGELLRASGIRPDIVFTSLLGRSIMSAAIALDVADRPWIDVERTWRLNERHYGAFQGQTRPAMLERYGRELFDTYRRSYDVRPPAIDDDSPYSQRHDPRYAPDLSDGLDGVEPSAIRGECLRDVWIRLEPYWRTRILPCLAGGRDVLVVTHGSVVRSMVKRFDGVSDADIRAINVPTGVPMAYEVHRSPDGGVHVAAPGRYLDPAAAAAGIAEVHALGRS